MALKKAATFSRAFQNVNGGVGPMPLPLLGVTSYLLSCVFGRQPLYVRHPATTLTRLPNST
jgi:hypothetical protein